MSKLDDACDGDEDEGEHFGISEVILDLEQTYQVSQKKTLLSDVLSFSLRSVFGTPCRLSMSTNYRRSRSRVSIEERNFKKCY